MASEKVILRWAERAVEQLEMLHAYVAEDNARAADALVDRVIETAEKLIQFPLLGRDGRVPGTRELMLPGTPIILAYRAHKNSVQIIAVIHGARRWPDSF